MEADEINGTAVYPDGLTGKDIDRLLGEAQVFWSQPSRATSALRDGSAALRRERRMARREMGAVVRAFPTLPSHSGTDDAVSDEVA